eukprot:Hpha_TRINITY_DN16538_c1_g17::TRINITY_DN16538_c1_g17_i2::g.134662::m.134662
MVGGGPSLRRRHWRHVSTHQGCSGTGGLRAAEGGDHDTGVGGDRGRSRVLLCRFDFVLVPDALKLALVVRVWHRRQRLEAVCRGRWWLHPRHCRLRLDRRLDHRRLCHARLGHRPHSVGCGRWVRVRVGSGHETRVLVPRRGRVAVGRDMRGGVGAVALRRVLRVARTEHVARAHPRRRRGRRGDAGVVRRLLLLLFLLLRLASLRRGGGRGAKVRGETDLDQPVPIPVTVERAGGHDGIVRALALHRYRASPGRVFSVHLRLDHCHAPPCHPGHRLHHFLRPLRFLARHIPEVEETRGGVGLDTRHERHRFTVLKGACSGETGPGLVGVHGALLPGCLHLHCPTE